MKKLHTGKEEILEILRKELPHLNERYGVEKMAIFGSLARDDQTEKSDVDILVHLGKPLGFDFIELSYYLEELLDKKVDLTTSSHLKKSMADPRYEHIALNIERDLIYV